MQTGGTKVRIEYDDALTRLFLIAGIAWGVVGMLAGVFVASQLAIWQMNLDTSWLTFGRLRPLHTNAAIFAFVGNMMFAGIFYSTQRLVKARVASPLLGRVQFWLWQAIIVAAAVTLPLGLTRGKEYAELIWPIDIAVAVAWVIFAVNFFWTLARRNEPSLYVAIWFYIATIVTVAILYIVNHLQIPTSWTHGYPLFGGVQDALVQWWYGHNAVAFFLTTPILGIMYYYLPKAAQRPVYSYRLSVVHFWSLVFIYIWAGPHHLLHTALPDWLQSLGMLFSLMLWAPSWGGMLNGLLTLRGAWHKVLEDPVLKFFAAGVTFYGMSTLEGPLLAIKSVNALSHYTDWTVGHVHSGTLGWNGFMAAGMFYWLAPRLWNTKLHSTQLANFHFWIGLVGILLYIVAMWISGIGQGLMLNATVEGGGVLKYPAFLDAVIATKSLMHLRMLGGMLYLSGFILLAYNVWRTAASGRAVNGVVEVFVASRPRQKLSLAQAFTSAPVMFSLVVMGCVFLWAIGWDFVRMLALLGMIIAVVVAVDRIENRSQGWGEWYDRLLANSLPFTVLTVFSVLVGGLVEIIPTIVMHKASNVEGVRQIPYTALQLAGRDIYIREGCYNCHSQMVRPFVSEVLRYGEYSKLGESIYDHPYQWGSKRTGPDLHRVGGKYPNVWHVRHMENPRSVSIGSTMPNYPWLLKDKTDIDSLHAKFRVLRQLGVPYPERTPERIRLEADADARVIADDLRAAGVNVSPDREIVALIAYLQQLGKSETIAKTPTAAARPHLGAPSGSQP